MTYDEVCPTCTHRADELEHAEALIADLRADKDALEAANLNLRAQLHAAEAERDYAKMAYAGMREAYRIRVGEVSE